jgi:adenylosuccinate lyase
LIDRYTLPEMGRLWGLQAQYERWLAVEMAATEAQAELGHIPAEIPAEIEAKASFSVERIAEIEAETHHDVIAFVTNVSETSGPAGRYIHYGMTSSDVVDTALSLAMRDAADILIKDIEGLLSAVKEQALKHKHTVTIGRTHGIHAEPTTFGLKLLLWYFELERDLERVHRARETISVGKFSGAVGTYSNIDPDVEELACEKLGLQAAKASSQVIQRDRHAEYMSALAIVGGTLEKIATEIRHLQRTEVLEAEEPFAKGQKGSSAMPHKRNPIITERLTGMARLLRGYANSAIENMALWHERDISHSSVERVAVPDATILLDYMLHKATWIIKDLQVYPHRMEENLNRTHGLVFSQRVLLALIDKGLAREDAYRLVQRNAMLTWKEEVPLKDNLLADKEVEKYLSEAEIDDCLNVEPYLRNIDRIFARLDS